MSAALHTPKFLNAGEVDCKRQHRTRCDCSEALSKANSDGTENREGYKRGENGAMPVKQAEGHSRRSLLKDNAKLLPLH